MFHPYCLLGTLCILLDRKYSERKYFSRHTLMSDQLPGHHWFNSPSIGFIFSGLAGCIRDKAWARAVMLIVLHECTGMQVDVMTHNFEHVERRSSMPGACIQRVIVQTHEEVRDGKRFQVLFHPEHVIDGLDTLVVPVGSCVRNLTSTLVLFNEADESLLGFLAQDGKCFLTQDLDVFSHSRLMCRWRQST